jgi:hypothetical protein
MKQHTFVEPTPINIENMKTVLSSATRIFILSCALAIGTCVLAQQAREGVMWKKVEDPDFVLQLQRAEGKEKSYDLTKWADLQDGVERAKNYCAYTVTNKTGDYSSAVHRFSLTADKRAARSEMKVAMGGRYRDDGIYQFEGELRFQKGVLSASHVMQIWQNMKKTQNKILIYSVRTANGGNLYVPSNAERVGTFKRLPSILNRYNEETGEWLKVNVIHDRVARKVSIYLGDSGELYSEYVHGEADGEYYFKFGAYGRIPGEPLQPAVVEWRHVKIFEGERSTLITPHR